MLNRFLRAIAPQPTTRPRHVPSRHALLGRKELSWLLLPMLISTPTMALDNAKQETRNNVVQVKKVSIESPIKYSGILYRSGNRRDPFLNPILIKRNAKPEADEEISRGLPPPGIAGTYIAQAALQGTAIRDDGRIAVVRGADSRAYFLKEGDRLFDGYLKTIESDSITLVRETKLRSGKTLTQDVTKRLRTP